MNNSKTLEAFKASENDTIIVQNSDNETYRVTLDFIEPSDDHYQYLAQEALFDYGTVWTAYDGTILRTDGPELTSEELDALFSNPNKFVLPVKMTDGQIVETTRENADFYGITDKEDEFNAFGSLGHLNDALFCDLYCFIIQEIDNETGEDYGDQILSEYYLDNEWDNMEGNLSDNINEYRIIKAQ